MSAPAPASASASAPVASEKPGAGPSDHVPFAAKTAYGAAGIVDVWAGFVPKNMANQVFNMSLGMSPTYISLAFLVFRVWDAITDPLMGWISDRTRTRWGRRRPFILLGGVLTALVFPLMWFVPASWSEEAMLGWMFATGILLYTCFTVWAMPYQSLLLEMSPDYHERTRVAAFRAFFQKFGGVAMGWIWAITQLPFFLSADTGKPDTLLGMRVVSIVLAVIILVIATLPFFFVRERYYEQASKSQVKQRFFDSVRQTFRNKPFVVLVFATIAFSVGTHMTAGFGIYVNTFYVQGGDKTAAAVMTGWINTAGLVTGLASLPLFQWLTRRYGKHRTLMIAMGLVAASSLLTWFTFNPDYPWLVLANAVLNSPGLTGLWLVIPSMTADVVDQDELDTGARREGSYAAVYSWVVKFGTAIGFGISGPLLDLTGFHIALGAEQPEEVITRLRLCNAIIPATAMAVALACILRYRLTAERLVEIRSQLEARRGRV